MDLAAIEIWPPGTLPRPFQSLGRSPRRCSWVYTGQFQFFSIPAPGRASPNLRAQENLRFMRMRNVVDSNLLQSAKLRDYLARSPRNFAVLTDYAAMEA